MKFTSWSDTMPEAKKTLKPDFGIKNWNTLTEAEKNTIWKHFVNNGWFASEHRTYKSIYLFADDHKASGYCNNILNHGGPHYYDDHGSMRMQKDCCNEFAQRDFNHIFHNQPQDVVYELFSYYANQIAQETYNNRYPNFVAMFNDISAQFNLNVLIKNDGFILRQDDKIIENIYEPVLKFLSDKKWEVASRDFDDAFNDYLKNTQEGFSSCLTHTISGLQGFLQILISGETGKGNGEIAELIKQGIKEGKVPDDEFSKRIFKDSLSILMIERSAKGDPHPKDEYADEKTAKLLLNLTMVFIQHCLQK